MSNTQKLSQLSLKIVQHNRKVKHIQRSLGYNVTIAGWPLQVCLYVFLSKKSLCLVQRNVDCRLRSAAVCPNAVGPATTLRSAGAAVTYIAVEKYEKKHNVLGEETKRIISKELKN